MKGLSVTAIGARPLEECLNIFETLKDPLGLDFLELAVGSRCDLSKIPKDSPLVIHHRCLFDGLYKLPFSLAHPETWEEYRHRLRDRNVKMISIHPPMRKEISFDELKQNRDKLEALLGIPVCLEVMPNDAYWLSEEDFSKKHQDIRDIPILLDISHVNIWSKGCSTLVQEWTKRLMPQAIAIHLSHNNGRRDSHDLIPSNIWFNQYIQDWEAQGVILTYESLPESYGAFERSDKQRTKQLQRRKR
ncbi:hypothetical protein [Cyanothece sp. BG0011]|uniref:hypothetical protein n=1 Tax=Cyanothece sp. BG0011 TaxID=2082950 RepID=UPI000D1DEBB2|nr:hypothetical protein [Cyanothece sp. BG0011]